MVNAMVRVYVHVPIATRNEGTCIRYIGLVCFSHQFRCAGQTYIHIGIASTELIDLWTVSTVTATMPKISGRPKFNLYILRQS